MKVKDICNLQNGRAFKPDDWGTEGIPIIRIQNLNDMSAPFNYYAGEYSPVHEINDGELLFSWSGTPGTSFGAFRWNRGKGVLNQHIFKVLPKIDVDKDYLKYALNGNINTIIAKAHGGVGLQHITKKELDEIDVPIVSKKEQLEIVEQLMCIEKIILLRQTELKKLNEIIQARFVERFWDCNNMTFLKDLCLIITDGTHQSPKFQNAGIPFIFVSNLINNDITYDTEKFISNDTYNELIKRTPIEIGDILLSTVGSYGHVAVVESEMKFLFQRHIAYIKPKRNIINSFYLRSALLSFDGQRQIEEKVKGIAQKTLNLSEIKKIMVPVPDIKQQDEFASFVKEVDKSKIVCLEILQKTAKFSCINPFL